MLWFYTVTMICCYSFIFAHSVPPTHKVTFSVVNFNTPSCNLYDCVWAKFSTGNCKWFENIKCDKLPVSWASLYQLWTGSHFPTVWIEVRNFPLMEKSQETLVSHSILSANVQFPGNVLKLEFLKTFWISMTFPHKKKKQQLPFFSGSISLSIEISLTKRIFLSETLLNADHN